MRTRPSAFWTTDRPSPRRRLPRLPLLLLVPVLVGLVGAPTAGPAQGDELSDALAKQRSLERQIKEQRSQVSKLNALQADLRRDIASTNADLRGIAVDLGVVRAKITKMGAAIEVVRVEYGKLVYELAMLDSNLSRLITEEDAKRDELAARKALLADRIRSAYETDQTSPLELFLTGASFTDVLSEVSYNIDVAEQDKALADQITKDKEALASIHAMVVLSKAETDEARKETAAQKREMDARMAEFRAAKKQLEALERETKRVLAHERAQMAQLQKNEKAAKQAIAKAQAAQAALKKRIDKLAQDQYRGGNIPSKYNGTFQWPMSGSISGNFGCSSYPGYGPGHGCAHFHNGIDIVAPCGTPVHAAAPGTVVYIGWNYADGSDPAWIVVIAHSANLKTWYAHMSPQRPVRAGQHVSAGQVIGYEASTGRSTGCHLHWMAELNGDFVNPRLFL